MGGRSRSSSGYVNESLGEGTRRDNIAREDESKVCRGWRVGINWAIFGGMR